MVPDRQLDGVRYLYHDIPLPYKILMALFLTLYAVYWSAVALGYDPVAGGYLLPVMGALFGVVLAINVVKMWPRMETALPRWFRTKADRPALNRFHRVLGWTVMGLVVLATLLILQILVFSVIMIMGTAGGVLIMVYAESAGIEWVMAAKRRMKRLWRGTFTALAIYLLIFVVLLLALLAANPVFIREPSSTGLSGYDLVLALAFGLALGIQVITIGELVLLTIYRRWMGWRLAKGSSYGPLRLAILRTHPFSLAMYLEMMNMFTGLFFSAYVYIIFYQSKAMQGSAGMAGGFSIDPNLDIIAIVTLFLAWGLLLVNLSGTAVRSARWYINRDTFASATVVILMAIFLQAVITHGSESQVSLLFRVFYLVGIFAPIIVFWRRWRRQSVLLARDDLTRLSGQVDK